MKTQIRRCHEGDLEAICQIAYETYDAAFRPMNKPAVIDAYLKHAFTLENMRQELICQGSHFYFLYLGKALAGYLKVNEGPAQSDIRDAQALEIERIYVRPPLIGKGLGKALLAQAETVAQELKLAALWLGVWEKNLAAIAFYQRHGFAVVGQHGFQMGEELQTDFIMRKELG